MHLGQRFDSYSGKHPVDTRFPSVHLLAAEKVATVQSTINRERGGAAVVIWVG